MKPLYLTKLVVVAAILFTCNWGANAQTTFNYTGGVQTYSVPNGVTAIGVDLAGASGGNGECWSTNAGGGRVVCNLAVTGGQPLYI